MFYVELRHPRAIDLAELKASDLRMYSGPGPKPLSTVAIAEVDDKSIAALGHWPWPRNVMARFEQALSDDGAAVVGYDLLFSEPDGADSERRAFVTELRQAGVSEAAIGSVASRTNDSSLADAIRKQGKTYLSYSFERLLGGQQSIAPAEGYISEMRSPPPMAFDAAHRTLDASPALFEATAYSPPIPELAAVANGSAFANIDADRDGVDRSMLAVVKFHDRYCIPLSLALLQAVRGGATLSVAFDKSGVEGVRLGDTDIPINEHGQMLINFRGPEGTFPHYSISDVIDHKTPARDLAGKIVLVGLTGRGLGDRFVTPMGGDFPGVEIAANAIDNVSRGDFVRRSFSRDSELLAGLLLGFLVAVLVSWLPPALAAAAALAVGGIYLAYAQQLLWRHGVLVGVVFPIATVIVVYTALATYRYVTEGLEKRRLRRAFEFYLHPDVIASVVENPETLKLGGERRNLSILFADIVNYTGLSERTDPAALVAILNDYMTKMTDRILESGGVVDKIRGDGIMAFWGAPIDIPNHAQAAIDSALAMLSELQALQATDPRFADFDIGVGIATGQAIVGNFGGRNRFDYSVIGDTVNLASRLEGLTRQFKVHLLVSLQSLREAGGDYVAREIGLVTVKGKTQAVSIAEVAGHASDGIDQGFYQRHQSALESIRRGDSHAARAELLKLRSEWPRDEVIRLYLDKLDSGNGQVPNEMTFEFDTK
jgi:adenylate cyclase